MKEEMVLSSKRKWFWIGIVLCFITPPIPGLIYGIAMLTEGRYRKEGLIIVAWSIVWLVLVTIVFAWLVKSGYFHLNLPAGSALKAVKVI